MGEQPACSHDYVLSSRSVGSKPYLMNVLVMCSRCGHERELRDAQLTDIDYGDDPESIMTMPVEFEEMPKPDPKAEAFYDWWRARFTVPKGGGH